METPDVSPYKEPSKAETNRKMLLVPLCAVPAGIWGYLFYVKEGSKGADWFSLHPLMMMTAFLTLSGTSILTKKMGGRDNTFMHGYLIFAASAAASFGSYVIWSNKEAYGRAHLTTNHGQVGALVLMSFVFYPFVAYAAYNPDTGFLRTNQQARKMHKLSGRFIVFGALVASAMGIWTMEKDRIKAGGLIVSLFALSPFFLL